MERSLVRVLFGYYNGVKRCSVYMLMISCDLVRLSKIGVGCFIGRKFVGALAYMQMPLCWLHHLYPHYVKY